MKKLVVLFMCVVLVGCGSSIEDSSTSKEEASKVAYEGQYQLNGFHKLFDDGKICLNADQFSKFPEGVSIPVGQFDIKVCFTNENLAKIMRYDLDTKVEEGCVYGNGGTFMVKNMYQQGDSFFAEMINDSAQTAYTAPMITCF